MLKRGMFDININEKDQPDDSALFELIVKKGIEHLNANGYDAKIDSVLSNGVTVKSIKVIIRDSLK
ncbi:hypothetical protein NF716_00855 [Lactococcus formosensis]|uniref:hypothetical protein n=1 Tax=Lactococcus formosensis TaxID=1281486 RepID=UPI0024360CCE|nr:hypothetical protein [Lactococcus formosensis]MDG6154912.1 hypothetical protein [Lactococcus formosensis]